MPRRLFALAIVCALSLPACAKLADPSIIAGFSRASPSAMDVALAAIDEARTSIRLAAYQFTSPDIIDALRLAKSRGVDVRVILDRTQRNGEGQALMVDAEIPCFIEQKHRIMHHKFMVIDGLNVETGSFNYTRSADKVNAENALLVRGAPELAQIYTKEWERLQTLPTTVACPGLRGEGIRPAA